MYKIDKLTLNNILANEYVANKFNFKNMDKDKNHNIRNWLQPIQRAYKRSCLAHKMYSRTHFG